MAAILWFVLGVALLILMLVGVFAYANAISSLDGVRLPRRLTRRIIAARHMVASELGIDEDQARQLMVNELERNGDAKAVSADVDWELVAARAIGHARDRHPLAGDASF